ncbi:MAG: ATP synthase F0 subunit C [Candidatus Schekmanbacteria bacterium]|nr:MAG: ATP synthase F0 subunit C [Candidatus Schekmanbacteria bacterium]
MKKVALTMLVLMFACLIFAPTAMAEEAAEGAVSGVNFTYVWVACAFGIAIAAFGGALGQGRSVSSAMEGIARNPNASGKIQTAMIIGLALIESLVIYALVVVLILLFK